MGTTDSVGHRRQANTGLPDKGKQGSEVDQEKTIPPVLNIRNVLLITTVVFILMFKLTI